MSYNVSITRNTISPYDRQAWDELENMLELENGTDEKGDDFLYLIEKLNTRFPCITTLREEEIDNGVWSDGPLSNNAGKNVTTLGVTWPNDAKVMPFLIRTSNDNGFVVFDTQTNTIHRPQTKNTVKPATKTKSENWWNNLFKN